MDVYLKRPDDVYVLHGGDVNSWHEHFFLHRKRKQKQLQEVKADSILEI